MARNPKKASKRKRARKGKIQDLPAGKKAKGVKGGAFSKIEYTWSSEINK